jgi:uncharacterized protein
MEQELDNLRRFYDAFGHADWDTAGKCFTADAVWRLPGRSQISGEYHGWTSILNDFFAKLGPLTNGTFRSRLVEVLSGDRTLVAYQHATGQRDGRHLDVTACQVITFRDGLIDSVRGHYFDLYHVDEFWGPRDAV